jgi:hypothetical protein
LQGRETQSLGLQERAETVHTDSSPPQTALIAIPLAVAAILLFGVVQLSANPSVEPGSLRYCLTPLHPTTSTEIAQLGKVRNHVALGQVVQSADHAARTSMRPVKNPARSTVSYIRCQQSKV